MRYLSWLLSFLLHTALFVILMQTIRLAPLELKDVMEVDLTMMERAREVAPLPVPEPMPEIEVEQPKGAAVSTPLPQDKTVVIDDSPAPPQPAPAAPEPASLPEPDVVEISPVKTPVDEEKVPPERVNVRRNDTIVHRGHEARFGRALMADYYSYSSTEFSGQFKTKDDRTISIIDARNTKYGRFLIYDSKNKTLRRMKQFGKYVYTIGPSVYEDEPVFGTVTFLAKNDRIERFILMTDDDRMAHYPLKVHVREEDVKIPTAAGALAGYASLPPAGEDHPGVVFLHGNRCVEPGLIHGFTRALSARNLASLAFNVRGCSEAEGRPGEQSQLVTDTAAAFAYLVSLPEVAEARAGLWGNGQGVPVAIKAAVDSDTASPAYVVCLLDDSLDPKMLPERETLANLTMPTLWLITGRDTNKWQNAISILEKVRDVQKRPFTIVVAPLKASQDVVDAKTEQSGLVEQVTEDHARLAVSWIKSLSD